MRKMSTRSKRDGNIEILRFLFSLGVVLFHGGLGVRGGYLGVEFFFMLTGAFLAKSLDQDSNLKKPEPFVDTCSASLQYLKKRVIKIYPSFFLSTLIGAVVTIIGDSEKLRCTSL